MQHLLTDDEYNELKQRSIPKDVFDKWKSDCQKSLDNMTDELNAELKPLLHEIASNIWPERATELGITLKSIIQKGLEHVNQFPPK